MSETLAMRPRQVDAADRRLDHSKHCSKWSKAERADVAEVILTTSRDDCGISYEVNVALRSFAAHAFEMGEDQRCVWTRRVEFGSTDETCSGGAAFVRASRQQAAVADEIAAAVWGGK